MQNKAKEGHKIKFWIRKVSSIRNVDDLLELSGGINSRYSFFVIFVMILCTFIPGMVTLSPVFTAAVVEYNCSKDWINKTFPNLDNMSISDDQCLLSASDGTVVKEYKCTQWDFNKDEFLSTIVTKFELICKNAPLRFLPSIAFFLGYTIGCIIYGNISDIYGRKRVMIVALLHLSFSLIGSTWMPTFWSYTLVQVVTGCGNGGLHTTLFTFAIESFTTEWRSMIGFNFHNGWSAGMMLLTLVAYYERRHSYLIIYCAVATLVLLPLCLTLSESPRWLLSQKRIKEAAQVFKRISRINKITIKDVDSNGDEETIIAAENTHDYQQPEQYKIRNTKYTVLDLFRSKGIAKISIITYALFFTVSMTYYGISLSVGDLSGSIFANQIYLAIVESPARLIGVIASKKFGRKCILMFSFLLTGGCLLASVIIFATNNTFLSTARTVFAVAAKFWITLTFDAVWIYSGEVFPTVIRTIGSGSGSAMARIGALCSQALQTMEMLWKPLPIFIFALAPFLVPLILIWAPETLGEKLPQTIKEGETFSRKNNGCLCWNKKKKERINEIDMGKLDIK